MPARAPYFKAPAISPRTVVLVVAASSATGGVLAMFPDVPGVVMSGLAGGSVTTIVTLAVLLRLRPRS